LTQIKNSLTDKWLKASILGSLWASIEILFGSFLHNMKIPFTGTFLSFVAIILIISFIKNWNQPGIVIRSALICSIMKSISPSAVIIGPMVGILMEGVLFELSITLLGRNIFGFLVGGILAVLSPIIQNISLLIIMYGANIIEIFYKVTNTISKGFGYPEFNPSMLLFLFLGLNIILGTFAVFSGLYLGTKTKNIETDEKNMEFILDEEKKTFDFTSNRKYSITWLILHIILIISILLCQNQLDFIYSTVIIIIYSIYCIYQYRFLFIRFNQNRVWLEFGLIILLSSMILGGLSSLNNIFMGLVIGFQMILRAIVIIFGFSIIGYELRNPIILNWFINILGRQFYLSLDLAFLTLPAMTSILIKQKKIFRHPVYSFIQLFAAVNRIIESFQHTIRVFQPKVVIISGKVNSGKTTLLKSIINELKGKDFKIAGIITENFYKGNEKYGFDIIDLANQEKAVLCRKNELESDIKAGPYYFSKEGIRFGERVLENIQNDTYDFVVLDEIGNLELKGSGWSNSIDNLLMISNVPMIFVIRENLVNKVCRRWNIKPLAVYSTNKDNLETIIKNITEI
jgi:nucleoside-triphosphatase THEP1